MLVLSAVHQGQYYDCETELCYNRFRYYSPDSGTYISQDPIGLASGEPNFYAYVPDVNSWVDVFGLSCSKNAKELRNNMAKEGRSVNPGEAAAHIVASGGSKRQWAPAARSRKILEKYGVNINDAANGIPLGHPTPHNITHRRVFHEMVENRLNNVVDKMSNSGRKKIKSALRKELRDIGKGVLNGL